MLLNLLVFALFWLGHACLWMVTLNVVYSQPLPRGFLKKFRLVVGASIWLGPPLLGALLTWDLLGVLHAAADGGGHLALAGYIVVCLLVSCVLLPLVTAGAAGGGP